jgi:predicted secreted protein
MTQAILLSPRESYDIEKRLTSGTGYTWITSATEGLNVVSRQIPYCEKPGCGRKIVWTISAQDEGIYLFSLLYTRPWELKHEYNVEIFVFHVTKKDITTVLFYLNGNTMVGYRYKDVTYTRDGKTPKYSTMVAFRTASKLTGNLTLYKKDSEYFYLSESEAVLYNEQGNKVAEGNDLKRHLGASVEIGIISLS